MSTTRPMGLEPLPATTRRIDGRVEFQAAVREALEQVAARGDPELILCDPDFADWPLGERRTIAAFESWANSRRRLFVLAGRYDEVVRLHPRWVEWRRTWAHIVECRALVEHEAATCPTVLLAPTGPLVLRLHDGQRLRGIWSTEPRDATQAREFFDALVQRSTESFGATTLGL